METDFSSTTSSPRLYQTNCAKASKRKVPEEYLFQMKLHTKHDRKERLYQQEHRHITIRKESPMIPMIFAHQGFCDDGTRRRPSEDLNLPGSVNDDTLTLWCTLLDELQDLEQSSQQIPSPTRAGIAPLLWCTPHWADRMQGFYSKLFQNDSSEAEYQNDKGSSLQGDWLCFLHLMNRWWKIHMQDLELHAHVCLLSLSYTSWLKQPYRGWTLHLEHLVSALQ